MPDDHAPVWTHVPPAVATTLDALSETCEQLVMAWGRTAKGLADPPPAGSVVSQDEKWFYDEHPDAPGGLGQAAGRAAVEYVDAIGQHLQAVRALLLGRRVTLSIWAVVRAELELAGRVGWLVDPGSGTRRINGSQRVARFLMDGLAAICRARYTAGRMRNQELVRSLKRERERIRGDIGRLFPGSQIGWERLGDEDGWIVGGETYLKLGEGVDQFSRGWLSDARGMYDTLSDLTHPSLPALAAQTKRIDHGDRIEMIYVVDPDTTDWQVQLACQTMYKAAHLVTGYLALPVDHLEAWAQRAVVDHPSWFSTMDDSA